MTFADAIRGGIRHVRRSGWNPGTFWEFKPSNESPGYRSGNYLEGVITVFVNWSPIGFAACSLSDGTAAVAEFTRTDYHWTMAIAGAGRQMQDWASAADDFVEVHLRGEE